MSLNSFLLAMSHIVIDRNDLPHLLSALPGVVAARVESATGAARGAAQKGVEESGEPSSDTGALREGMVVEVVGEGRADSDFEARKADARTHFTQGRSRFDPKGRMHTEENFERLCNDLEPAPTRNRYEVLGILTVLMKYGAWFEEGNAWNLAENQKRPATPWFEPAVMAWAASDLESHFDGVVEESLR